MPESSLGQGDATLWWIVVVAFVLLAAALLFFWTKGRPMTGQHVFRASRFSRGNFLFPTQVAVNPSSIVHFTPEMVGGREQSIHMAHVASVLVDRNLFFSNVLIETSGGASPVRCHGHRKPDAIEMKRLIEQFQSAYYRGQQTQGKTDTV
ncbi:MAG: hypothetical protein ABIP65_04005 [Vicinamibacterales bacterium]